MNSILKYAGLGISGVALFTGTYVGIAAISGAPLHEVAGLSSFFDAPASEETPGGKGSATSGDGTSSRPSGKELLEENAGLLGAFMVESPFTSEELRNLEKELKKQLREMRVERERLVVRSLELDEREAALRERQAQLANQRTMLEDLETSVDLKIAEFEHAETVSNEQEMQGWRQMAKLYKGGKPEVNALMLVEESPEEAAIILHELGDRQAGPILRAIQPASERKKFLDAYRVAVVK
jgi:flagellar motility protein MotE (MotC chaperone)